MLNAELTQTIFPHARGSKKRAPRVSKSSELLCGRLAGFSINCATRMRVMRHVYLRRLSLTLFPYLSLLSLC